MPTAYLREHFRPFRLVGNPESLAFNYFLVLPKHGLLRIILSCYRLGLCVVVEMGVNCRLGVDNHTPKRSNTLLPNILLFNILLLRLCSRPKDAQVIEMHGTKHLTGTSSGSNLRLAFSLKLGYACDGRVIVVTRRLLDSLSALHHDDH